MIDKDAELSRIVNRLKREELKSNICTVLVAVLGVILLLGLSWLITCGVFKLITMCFDIEFNWYHATGVWLVLGLLEHYLKSTTKK